VEGLSATPVAVLFDVDGTLAETECDGHRVAFNQAFADAGLSWQWNESRYGELLRIAGGKERIAFFAARHAPDWLAQRGAAVRVAALHGRKNAIYAQLVARGAVALRPGVAPLFAAIERVGWTLGIVTTTSRANVEALFNAALPRDALRRFAVVICGEDVARKKPDPSAYRLALQRLRNGTRAVAVEDSRNGLLAARGAGIATVVVRSRYGMREDFSEAAAVFDAYAHHTTTQPALDLAALRRVLA